MTSPAGVPRTIADITPRWLTHALRERFGLIKVEAVEVAEVLHGTATKVRLVLDHDGGEVVPDHLCLKAGLEDHSRLMAETGIYANEARFFREIRDSVGVAAPRWWWAGVEEGSQRGGVLMDDLGTGVRFCRATQPLSVDEVEAGLAVLATCHAARFGSRVVDSWPWLPPSVVESSPSARYFRTLGPEVIAAELAKPARAAAVPAELSDPDRIVQQFWAWVATNEEGPMALLHGDAHIGNLYIDRSSPGFCDWQTVRYGRPMFDVSYFIGSALTAEDRRTCERPLIASYRDRLMASVGQAPSPDDLWLDYRRDMNYGFFAWLTNLDVFQPEEINAAAIGRFATAMIDLDSARAVGISE